MTEYITEWYWDERRNAPNQAQREKIVRCRDCAHWATEARFTGMCIGKRFNPDGFCAWGEKKEDDDGLDAS